MHFSEGPKIEKNLHIIHYELLNLCDFSKHLHVSIPAVEGLLSPRPSLMYEYPAVSVTAIEIFFLILSAMKLIRKYSPFTYFSSHWLDQRLPPVLRLPGYFERYPFPDLT